MTETRYDALPALRDPARFLATACADLVRSFPIAWHLFRGELRARYRLSYLGYLWLLVPAAVTTATCVYLQSRHVIDVGSPRLPYAVHVLTGIVLWQVFMDALNTPLQSLLRGRQLITRSQVPNEALFLAGVLDVVLNFALRALLLIAVVLAYGVNPAITVFLMPLGAAALMALGLAIGLLLVPFGLLYGDVGRTLLLVSTLWFFLTPVVYPPPRSGLLLLNPVTPFLETSRTWLTTDASVGTPAIVAAVAAVGLLAAWLFQRLARPHVVARLG